MADPLILKNLACWLGGYDFSGYLTSVNLTGAKVELPDGRFGDTAEVSFPGLQQIVAEAGGFFGSDSALAPDPVLWARVDQTLTPAVWPLLFVPPSSPSATPNTVGNRGYMVVGRQFAYSFSGQHGQSMPFNFATKPGSGYALFRQRIEAAKAAVSETTTSAGFQYGALSASEKMVVSLHVFDITGSGSWTLTIESDDNSGFASATVRDTFTIVDQDDDPTTQVREIAGAVADDYWRAVMTETSGTSSLTYAVSLGINRA